MKYIDKEKVVYKLHITTVGLMLGIEGSAVWHASTAILQYL